MVIFVIRYHRSWWVLLVDYIFYVCFQKSSRAITDIDRRVRGISTLARKYYSAIELSPHLDDLEQHSEETLQMMNDLSMSLRCEPIFR